MSDQELEAISEGVRRAFSAWLESLSKDDVLTAIRSGVDFAFDVYPSDVLHAIADGTREALEPR